MRYTAYTDISNFPALKKLKWIDLSNNKIKTGLKELSESNPQLEYLNLRNNELDDEQLSFLKNLKKLKELDIRGNSTYFLKEYIRNDAFFRFIEEDLDKTFTKLETYNSINFQKIKELIKVESVNK